MNTKRIIIGLLLLNLGVFFTTAAFLPRAGMFFYTNPIEHFINARTNWDVAWSATLGSSLLSSGLVFLCWRGGTSKREGKHEAVA